MDKPRKQLQDMFMRIACDSGFAMSGVEVAVFLGNLLKCSPFTVYAAFGDMSAMNAVADGSHPAVKKFQENM